MDTIETLQDYIEAFFNGTKTERESMIAFVAYRDSVMESIPTLDATFLKEQPAIVATGLLGKLDFKEGPHLTAFIAQPDLKTLAKLRENAVVNVADSARPAWVHLVKTDEKAACVILSLCAQARKHVRVLALKPKAPKTAKPKKMAESQ